MAVTCPLCHRPATVEAPCSTCWRTLPPADRAPWIRRMRRDEALAPVAHRDPVRTAPPTLAAYVAYLEALLVEAATPQPTAPTVDPVTLPGLDDLACPRCGSRLLWSLYASGEGSAYCIRSGHATARTQHPQIADGTCSWTGPIERTPGGGVRLVTP